MYNLYDFGYIGNKLANVVAVVQKTGATVVDIRFSPFSRNPAWNKRNLETILGEHYKHERNLGNLNYKVPGMENVQFVDLIKGLGRIGRLLLDNHVIVMCACKDRNHCHRLLAVQEFERLTGMASIPLDQASLKELAGIKEDKQLLMMI